MKRILLLIMCFVPIMLMGQNALTELKNIHQVQKGETIQEIALRYNVSEEALRYANPEVSIKKNGRMKSGIFLTIPRKVQQPVQTAPVMEVQMETKQVDTNFRSLNVGVLLPLEEGTARAEKLVEFYQGLLMAADSVKREGANLNIHTYHCGNDVASMQKLLASKQELSDMHIIFGPADEAQIPVLADFCRGYGVRLVLPFSNSQPNAAFPLMYTTVPNQAVTMEEAINLSAKVHKGYNYIILKSGNADARGREFTQLLKKNLAARGIAPKELDLEADSTAYEAAFSQFQVNCMIPDNTDIKTLNILISKLDYYQQIYPQYQLCLLGYPQWRTYTGMLLNSFHRFDTYIYSTYYYNPTSEQTDAFQKQFFNNFGRAMQISYPRYAMMGFDMAYYFLHGLVQQGDTFENMQESLIYQPYQHPFRFVRDAAETGFTNRFVQLIHYSPDMQIQLIR